MALETSDKLPPIAASPSPGVLSEVVRSAANHRRNGKLKEAKRQQQRHQLQLRQKKLQQIKKNGKKNMGKSTLKSASWLKKSLDNDDEEGREDEDEGEEGEEEEEDEEGGDEEEDEEEGEEEGEESEVEEDNEDPDAEEDDESNPRITKPTTTTTTTTPTPLINLASAETEEDFIDRPIVESNSAVKESRENAVKEEEISQTTTATTASSSASSELERNKERNEIAKTDPDDDETDDATEVAPERRPAANQMNVMENGKTEQEEEEEAEEEKVEEELPTAGNKTADDVKTDLISGTPLDADIRWSYSSRNQTDAANWKAKAQDERADDRSVGDKIQPSAQVENQLARSKEPAKSSPSAVTSNSNEDTSAEVEESNAPKDPTGRSHFNVISEEDMLLPRPVLESSVGSQVESASSEEDERDEANEIRAQVQPEIKSPSAATPSGIGASLSSDDDDDADEEINDIKLDSFGNNAAAKTVENEKESIVRNLDENDIDDGDEDDDDSNFLPASHNSGIIISDKNKKPAVNDASPGGAPLTDIGAAGSGDVEDETNNILPDDPVKTSLTSVSDLDEQEEEDFVDNEIETKMVTSAESTFGRHDPNRFLHGQVYLNPSVLDTSCGPSTVVPVIPNAVVAKYGRCVCVCVDCVLIT